jgi:hypothetical protein
MEKKTFAFKLADKSAKSDGKWKARDGVALAGCTELPNHNYRDNIFANGHPAPEDGGYFC